MPYIKSFERLQIAENKLRPMNPGQLNYLLTKELIEENIKHTLYINLNLLIAEYIDNNGLNYQIINDLIGALVCCGEEYKRRTVNYQKYKIKMLKKIISNIYSEIAAPYEDKKILENGDVYSSMIKE